MATLFFALVRSLVLVTIALAASTIVLFAQAQSLPKGFANHKFNDGNNPTVKDGVLSFSVRKDECSDIDYGDGRGETDCKNGNLRSDIRYQQNFKVGQTAEYTFDLRLEKNLAYKGWKNLAVEGYYPSGVDSAFWLASWEGEFLHNFIYMLKADATNGITFMARECQSAAQLGQWVTFSLKVKWSSKTDGWVKVTCDDKLVYAAEGIATNQAPHCWESNQCEPWVKKNPKSFNFIVGINVQGWGGDWKKNHHDRVFTDILADQIRVDYRNFGVKTSAVAYTAEEGQQVKKLANMLIGMGCLAGPAESKSGEAFRQAVETCRVFKDADAPKTYSLLTLPKYLTLYGAPGVEKLEKGKLPGKLAVKKATFKVSAGEESAHTSGRDLEVNSDLLARIKGAKKGPNVVRFSMFGSFSFKSSDFINLSLNLQEELSKGELQKLDECSANILTYPDGSKHLKIEFLHRDNHYSPTPKLKCYLDALGKQRAAETTFLVSHFSDIAVGLVEGGTIKQLRHDGLKIFMERVATGEITVGENLEVPAN